MHRFAHAGLFGVHLVLCVLLVEDGALAQAGCVLAAALIYLTLCRAVD